MLLSTNPTNIGQLGSVASFSKDEMTQEAIVQQLGNLIAQDDDYENIIIKSNT